MTNSLVSGSLAMIQSAWHYMSGCNDHRTGELYQTSLMSALTAGVYEAETTYGQIREYGDFGLGTFNDLDGEMVGFDGTFYQLRSDGSARPVTDDQKTPFAIVTFFRPEQELAVVEPTAKSDLLVTIEMATDANLFTAVRVDGIFEHVRTRTMQRQVKPFPPLTEAARHQAENVFTNVSGTLAGFRSPGYAQGIGVAGFHVPEPLADRLRKTKAARMGHSFGSGSHAAQTRVGHKKIRERALQNHDPNVLIVLKLSAEFVEFLRQNLIEKIDWRVIDANECDPRIKREPETLVIRIWQGLTPLG